MAFIPFAATVGTWMGGSAALGGTAIAAGASALATSGVSAYQGAAAATQADKARKDVENRSNAALKAAEDQKKLAASQAQETALSKQRARAGSQSVFTSPLGLQGQASTARKTLLGQ